LIAVTLKGLRRGGEVPGTNGVVSVDQSTKAKVLSAVIGASAVVIMGTVAVVNEPAGRDTIRAAPEATATTTTPPTAATTSMATPATTASTPAGYR
jgi:hypothetical protein